MSVFMRNSLNLNGRAVWRRDLTDDRLAKCYFPAPMSKEPRRYSSQSLLGSAGTSTNVAFGNCFQITSSSAVTVSQPNLSMYRPGSVICPAWVHVTLAIIFPSPSARARSQSASIDFCLLLDIRTYSRAFNLSADEKRNQSNRAKCAARHDNEKTPVGSSLRRSRPPRLALLHFFAFTANPNSTSRRKASERPGRSSCFRRLLVFRSRSSLAVMRKGRSTACGGMGLSSVTSP
jgi:hypothetical protein